MKSCQILLCLSIILYSSCTREDDLHFQTAREVNASKIPLSASTKSVKRSFSEFLSAQGTTSDFLPPVPNYFGWGTLLDDGTVRLLSFDYLGFSNQTIINLGGEDLGTHISGSVIEQALADGRAKVRVNIHARDAMFWMTDVDFESGGDFASDPLIIGARPADIQDGEDPAIGSGSFQFDFINTAPGAPFPDILRAVFGEIEVEGFQLLEVKITASGDGILHAIPLHPLPWEDGDQGKMNVSFHDILFNNPSPKSKLAKNFGFVGSDLRLRKTGN